MSSERLRSGDRAAVRFRFLQVRQCYVMPLCHNCPTTPLAPLGTLRCLCGRGSAGGALFGQGAQHPQAENTSRGLPPLRPSSAACVRAPAPPGMPQHCGPALVQKCQNLTISPNPRPPAPYFQRPEYVTPGTRFVFREGRTKGIGVVVATEMGGA